MGIEDADKSDFKSKLAKLKATRRAYLGHLGSIVKEVDALVEVPDEVTVKALIQRLEAVSAKIEETCLLALDILADPDEVEAEIAGQSENKDKVILYQVKLLSLLPKCSNEINDAKSVTGSEENANYSGLPKLDLPKFSGDFMQWRPFIDQFMASVHSRDIPPVHKYTYLVSSLRDEAKNAILGIPCTGQNYKVALDILKNRFGDPSLLIGLYADKIVNLSCVDGDDVQAFRSLIDQFESCLREITQLITEISPQFHVPPSSPLHPTLPSSSSSNPFHPDPSSTQVPPSSVPVQLPIQDLLLAPLLLRKLPPSCRLEWARRVRAPKEKFNLTALLDFAKCEVEALESLNAEKKSSKSSVH